MSEGRSRSCEALLANPGDALGMMQTTLIRKQKKPAGACAGGLFGQSKRTAEAARDAHRVTGGLARRPGTGQQDYYSW